MGSDPRTAAVAVMDRTQEGTFPRGQSGEEAQVNSLNSFTSQRWSHIPGYISLLQYCFQRVTTDGLQGSKLGWFVLWLNDNKKRELGEWFSSGVLAQHRALSCTLNTTGGGR